MGPHLGCGDALCASGCSFSYRCRARVSLVMTHGYQPVTIGWQLPVLVSGKTSTNSGAAPHFGAPKGRLGEVGRQHGGFSGRETRRRRAG